MPKNFTHNGVDFDDLFDSDLVGDGPSATFLTSGGVALRYAALSYGSKRADVGFRDINDVDASNYWAAKGTASYAIAGLHGKTLIAGDNANTNQPKVQANVGFNLRSDGTWNVFGGNTHGDYLQPAPSSGTWNTYGGVASEFEAQFDINHSGFHTRVVTNGAPTWANLGNSRGGSLSLPEAAANNGTEREATASVRIRVRRASTGIVVSDSTVAMRVATVGYA